MSMKKLSRIFVALPLSIMLFSSPAMAALVECSARVDRVWAGDGGNIWIFFRGSSLAARIPSTSADAKNIITLATSALLADKWLTVRYDTTLSESALCAGSSSTDYGSINVSGVFLRFSQP